MITIQRGVFYNSLKSVSLFKSEDETREHLCTVYLETEKTELHIVATDGHTLAHALPVAKVQFDSGAITLRTPDVDALLAAVKPTRANAGDELTLTLGLTFLLTGPDFKFERAKPYIADFPPWRAVQPDKSDANEPGAGLVGFNPEYLGRAAKAATVFAGGIRSLRADRIAFEMSTNFDAKGGLHPMRLDFTHPDVGTLIIVIMPMRI